MAIGHHLEIFIVCLNKIFREYFELDSRDLNWL